jgi:argininosuccinate lyase
MSEPLWQKDGVRIDAKIMRFLAGNDVILDREFFLHDIAASRAHAEGLQRIGILSQVELDGLLRELAALTDDFRGGDFVLDQRYEDGHSAIEARLTERLGDVGRKIHTGRSRNDQILVATRLWLKDRLAELAELTIAIARAALTRGRESTRVPMPGYTHLQRAVISTLGHWHAGYAEAFIDNALRAQSTRKWVDSNPLGTAAGYGVNLPLDRDYTTARLGFSRLQLNPGYTQLSRGKFELAALEALGSAMLDLRRLAWDLSLFTTAEYGFVTLPAQYTTGSSIMPNKRNPDVVELMRASYAAVAAAKTEIEQLLSLPSGYQRDLQLSKGSLFHGFGQGLAALRLVPGLLAGLSWNESRLRQAIEPSMHATDIAIELAATGLPFRDAYRQVADNVAGSGQRSIEGSIDARVSTGACGALELERLEQRLAALEADR